MVATHLSITVSKDVKTMFSRDMILPSPPSPPWLNTPWNLHPGQWNRRAEPVGPGGHMSPFPESVERIKSGGIRLMYRVECSLQVISLQQVVSCCHFSFLFSSKNATSRQNFYHQKLKKDKQMKQYPPSNICHRYCNKIFLTSFLSISSIEL